MMNKNLLAQTTLIILIFCIPLTLIGCGGSKKPKELSSHTIACADDELKIIEYQIHIGSGVTKKYMHAFLKSLGKKVPAGELYVRFPTIAYSLEDLHLYPFWENLLTQDRFYTLYVDHNSVDRDTFGKIGVCLRDNRKQVDDYLKKSIFFKHELDNKNLKAELGAAVYGSVKFFSGKTPDSPFQFKCSEDPSDFANLQFTGSVYRSSGIQGFLLGDIQLPNEEKVYRYITRPYGSRALKDIDDCTNVDSLNIYEYFGSKGALLQKVTSQN